MLFLCNHFSFCLLCFIELIWVQSSKWIEKKKVLETDDWDIAWDVCVDSQSNTKPTFFTFIFRVKQQWTLSWNLVFSMCLFAWLVSATLLFFSILIQFLNNKPHTHTHVYVCIYPHSSYGP